MPIPTVIVEVTSVAGVILAPADTDSVIPNPDAIKTEVVTGDCICVTTLAYSPGCLADTGLTSDSVI